MSADDNQRNDEEVRKAKQALAGALRLALSKDFRGRAGVEIVAARGRILRVSRVISEDQ